MKKIAEGFRRGGLPDGTLLDWQRVVENNSTDACAGCSDCGNGSKSDW